MMPRRRERRGRERVKVGAQRFVEESVVGEVPTGWRDGLWLDGE